jgi:hypothetical protein
VGSSRRAAVLGVALCLLVQAAGAVHFGLVPHAICADHGELVDVVVHSAVQVDPDEGAGQRTGLHLPVRATLSGADGHCELAQLVRQLMPTAAAPIAIRGAGFSERLLEPRAIWHRLPLLRLAPKQSPPVRSA